MISPRLIVRLLIGALGLPIVICVLLGLVHLLDAMQDQGGAVVVGRFALVAGVIWVVDLIALIILQALQTAFLNNANRDEDAKSHEK